MPAIGRAGQIWNTSVDELGDLSPNPWDLSLSRQNGCLTLETLEQRTGLPRDATRAPIQGPEGKGGRPGN